MDERYIDGLLNIKTGEEQRGFHKSFHYHRYEPTPYSALESLFNHYELKSSDRVVDFGCGKGRITFYMNYLFNAEVVGVEMNESFYQEAVENRIRYLRKYKNRKDKIHFQCCLAEEYEINPLDNRFYFFNPFTIQIFRTVINNILVSMENCKREMELIIYYGSDDYTYFLDNYTSFELKEEIMLSGYDQNVYERFLIYRLE
ncbi:methyltransferase [Bacillus sp. Bva_UNVM-123]|uniref:class I SAM-dependent methyltransferase n=1 Tax=Bacillus sp. Bva_UNVM-123 TaxID=2829798 RepID=UPI00391FAB4F